MPLTWEFRQLLNVLGLAEEQLILFFLATLILVTDNLIDIVDYGYLEVKLFELEHYAPVAKLLPLAVPLLNYEASEVDFAIAENLTRIDGLLLRSQTLSKVILVLLAMNSSILEELLELWVLKFLSISKETIFLLRNK